MHRSLADDASALSHEAEKTPSPRQLSAEFSFPSWIDQWLGHHTTTHTSEADHIRSVCRIGSDRAMVIVEWPHARALVDSDFVTAASDLYGSISRHSDRLGLTHAVRAWNWIPGIHDRTADGDRYMSFNAGRYDAMKRCFGDALPTRVPAASGIGHDGSSLCIAMLLSRTPGRPIENVRQVPAYQYSSRFGRLPPCFARGTRWDTMLFVAGTAAVVGEESKHPRSFERQLVTTLDHLQSMLEYGYAGTATGRFTHFRAYLPHHDSLTRHGEAVERMLRSLSDVPVELIRADLCRSDLLVEIEAVADLASANILQTEHS